MERVAAVVLAGGQGTRLFPLTQYRCKPAVGFGGRYRLIDIPLSNALNSKISQLFVISQYFASSLHQHILATYSVDLFRRGSIELLCPEESHQNEEWFKGTADAVRKNLATLLKAPVDYFLILSGDQLYNIDFQGMVDFAREKKAGLVIAALPVEERDAERMGVLKLGSKGQVEAFVEKPKKREVIDKFTFAAGGEKRLLGSMGIYVFHRDALVELLRGDGDDFGRHLLPTAAKKIPTYGYLYNDYWVDIGTIQSFYEANMTFLRGERCLDVYDEANPIYTHPQHVPSPFVRGTYIERSVIGQGAIVEAKTIIRSVVGLRAVIHPDCVIEESVIMGNHTYRPHLQESLPLPKEFSIGRGSHIRRAIIDEQTKIGQGVKLLNLEGRETFDGRGIYIRDGIIIVPTGSEIPDGFTL